MAVNVAADGHDKGHAFIMMGVDTITGGSNGFLNITPDLGMVASQFAVGFAGTSVTSANSVTSLFIMRVLKLVLLLL